MKLNKQFGLSLIAGLAIMCALPAAVRADDETPPQQDFNPNSFVGKVDNEYFPLKSGTTYYCEGAKERVQTSDEMIVTLETKQILGVATTVVHHRSFENGVLVEDTYDWYAQDKEGNVWYFGEVRRSWTPAVL